MILGQLMMGVRQTKNAPLDDNIENDDDSDSIYVDTNVDVNMNLAQALYTKLFFLLGILWSIDAVQVPLSLITFDMRTFFSSIYFPHLRLPCTVRTGILSRFCDLVKCRCSRFKQL